MRTLVAVVLCLGSVAACGLAGCAGGPPSQPPASAMAEPASLLRRVAEAADGFRDGLDKYVVADRKFPHKVLGVFATQAEADDSLARAATAEGSDYERFGPFRTTEEPAYVEDSAEEVLEVIVVTRGGQKRYDAKQIDALFWGLPAFDKFIAPNLTVVGGVRYAAEQRELYRQGRSPLAHSYAIPHYRSSF